MGRARSNRVGWNSLFKSTDSVKREYAGTPFCHLWRLRFKLMPGALFREFPLTTTEVGLQVLAGNELAPPSASHRLNGHRSGNESRAAQTYGLGCSQCFPTKKRKMIFIAYADLNHATLPVLIALGYLEVRHISWDQEIPGNNKSARFVYTLLASRALRRVPSLTGTMRFANASIQLHTLVIPRLVVSSISFILAHATRLMVPHSHLNK